MSVDKKKNNQIHVTHRASGGWQAKKPGAQRASAFAVTKAEAMKKATEIAKKQKLELVPHNKDGKISNPNSFGNDPNPPKDQKK